MIIICYSVIITIEKNNTDLSLLVSKIIIDITEDW